MILLKSKQKAKLFFSFHNLPLKTTEISHFFEGKIEKVGVLFWFQQYPLNSGQCCALPAQSDDFLLIDSGELRRTFLNNIIISTACQYLIFHRSVKVRRSSERRFQRRYYTIPLFTTINEDIVVRPRSSKASLFWIEDRVAPLLIL